MIRDIVLIVSKIALQSSSVSASGFVFKPFLVDEMISKAMEISLISFYIFNIVNYDLNNIFYYIKWFGKLIYTGYLLYGKSQ